MQSILSTLTQTTETSNTPSSETQQHSFNFTKAIDYLYTALVFLLPIFFVPGTANIFNLNKTYLIIFVSILSLILFFAGSLKKGSLIIRDFRAYFAFVLLIIAASVSAFFSIDRYMSLFGVFGNYGTSLIVILALVCIGFVSANTRLNISRIMSGLFVGVSLATVVSLFAIYLRWLPLLGNAAGSFTTVEGTNLLIGLQLVVVTLAFYEMIKGGASAPKKALLAAVVVLNSIYPFAAMNILGVIGLLLGLASVIFIEFTGFVKSKVLAIIVLVLVMLFGIINALPQTRGMIGLDTYRESPRLGVIDSWLVSSSTLKLNPLVGRGLGTFQYEFSRYRPSTLNAGDQWMLRFQTPYNDIFMWLSAGGLLGIIAYLVFIYFVAKSAIVNRNAMQSGKFILIASLATIFALMLFGTTNILYVVLFILYGTLLQTKVTTVHTLKPKGIIAFLLVLSVLLLLSAGYKAFFTYAAESNYIKSLDSKKPLSEILMARRDAVNFEQQDDFYRREWVALNLNIATALSRQENLTEDQIKEIRDRISMSATQAAVLTRKSPYNVANWQLLGTVYSAVINAVPEGQQRLQVQNLALNAYSNAYVREPTNPRLYMDIGGIYYRAKDYRSAVNQYIGAVQQKGDYANARYNLAFALKDAGAYEQAVQQMEAVLRLVPQSNPAYEKAKTDLEDFKKLRDEQVAKKQDQKLQQVPESKPEDLQPKEPLDEPLQTPKESAEADVKPADNLNIEVPAEDKTTTAPEKLPAADGSTVDEKQGQTDSPIAKPAN